MPSNISFMLTTDQIRNRTKTVTRRLGWASLAPGRELTAVEKAMGLKAGERIVKLARLQVTAVRWEPLNQITQEDCAREGFPEMTPAEFVAFFCRSAKCQPDRLVNRIEFIYLD